MDHLISARRPDFIITKKKKRKFTKSASKIAINVILSSNSNKKSMSNKRKGICKIVDFAVPADHRINLKESET